MFSAGIINTSALAAGTVRFSIDFYVHKMDFQLLMMAASNDKRHETLVEWIDSKRYFYLTLYTTKNNRISPHFVVSSNLKIKRNLFRFGLHLSSDFH